MKTALKVIKTIFKGYGILTVLIWAFIGIGTMFKRAREYPDESVIEMDAAVFREALSNWKGES